MDKIDLDAMEQCHGVVVASAIFGISPCNGIPTYLSSVDLMACY
jgi:hypothetical protein